MVLELREQMSSVEVDAFLYFGRPLDEALSNVRHAVDGDLAEDLLVDRDVSPTQDLHAALVGDDLEHAHSKGALQCLLRQEKHSDAVVALAAQLNVCFLRRCLEELVRDLGQDADAVADLAGGVLAGPVLQFLHDDNASDAAGIVLLHVGAAGTVLLLVQHSFSSSAGVDYACDSASDSVSAVSVPFEMLEGHLNGNFFHFPSVCRFSAL